MGNNVNTAYLTVDFTDDSKKSFFCVAHYWDRYKGSCVIHVLGILIFDFSEEPKKSFALYLITQKDWAEGGNQKEC